MLQQGVIHFFYYSNLLLTLVEPRFNVISLPWLLPDTAAVDRVLEGPVGDQLLALLPAKGIVGALVVLGLVTFLPDLSLWLPRLLLGAR